MHCTEFYWYSCKKIWVQSTICLTQKMLEHHLEISIKLTELTKTGSCRIITFFSFWLLPCIFIIWEGAYVLFEHIYFRNGLNSSQTNIAYDELLITDLSIHASSKRKCGFWAWESRPWAHPYLQYAMARLWFDDIIKKDALLVKLAWFSLYFSFGNKKVKTLDGGAGTLDRGHPILLLWVLSSNPGPSLQIPLFYADAMRLALLLNTPLFSCIFTWGSRLS